MTDSTSTEAENGMTPEQRQLVDEVNANPAADTVPFSVTIDDESQSYVAIADGVEFGTVPFLKRDGRVTLLATSIVPEFRGMGLATELIRRILIQLRDEGRMITVRCPVFLAFLTRNPEYVELLGGRSPA